MSATGTVAAVARRYILDGCAHHRAAYEPLRFAGVAELLADEASGDEVLARAIVRQRRSIPLALVLEADQTRKAVTL